MANLILQECYGNGLRPKRDLYRDTRYCREFLNQLPFGTRGARTLRQVTYPLSSPSLSMAWPYPQILRDESQFLYFEDDAVYAVDSSSYPYATTARTVYSATEALLNTRFEDTSAWTEASANITVGNGAATFTSATSDNLTQAGVLDGSSTYLVTFTMTRSAGSLTAVLGSQAGTTRSSSGTFTETIVANGVDFVFDASGFTGTITMVSCVKQVSITATDAWQMVAFQNRTWFATNGHAMLFRLSSNPVDGAGRDVFQSTTNLTVQAVGKHNNALVIGGFGGSQLNLSSVSAAFEYWKLKQRQNGVRIDDDALDDTWLLYTEPAGLSETDWLYYVAMAVLGYPNTDEVARLQGVIRDRIDSGLLGFFRPRYCQTIRAIRQQGNNLIVYGKNGVSLLTRGQHGYEDTPLIDQGVPCRSAVAGDIQEHLFVGTRKDLWRIGGNGLERLDYSEYFENLTAANIVATFDPVRRVYFFGDGSTCYAWTGYGLGQSDAVIPSSLFRESGNTGLLGTAITKADPQTARIVTNTISHPNGLVMEASSMDVHCQESDATSWTATVDWRLRQSDQFKRPALIDVPDRGRCYVKKSGRDLRAVLSAPNYKEVSVDSVMLNIGQGGPAVANIFAGADTAQVETNP